jgi:hypothetical protein
MTIYPPKYLEANLARSGTTANCGDEVAQELDGLDNESLTVYCLTTYKLDISRWSHLNHGMQRMNAGNAIRKLKQVGKVEFLD